MRRVVVTGLGAVTPLGSTVRASWQALLRGECGVQSLALLQGLPSTLAAPAVEPATSALRPGDDRKTSRFVQLSLAATREALDDAAWHPETLQDRQRTGVTIASGIGGIDEFAATNVTLEQQGYRKISPFTIPRALTNMASGWVAMYHGLTGPNHCISTACAAGAHAIADAARLIMLDEADVVIAGASEASLSRLCIAGFAKAKALCTEYEDAPHEASRPFDQKRCGFVMGEGAGSLVMEERQHALDRGAHIYAELVGFGMSGDAHHITSPPSDGHGAALSMTRALQRAGMDLASVHHINCHATSTPLGDISEIRSIRSVFGDHAANISISATKAATGHLLGAAGAVEAIFAIKAIVEGVAPPTINLQQPDDEFVGLNLTPLQPCKRQIDTALTNSFGFGGTNASLLFTRHT